MNCWEIFLIDNVYIIILTTEDLLKIHLKATISKAEENVEEVEETIEDEVINEEAEENDMNENLNLDSNKTCPEHTSVIVNEYISAEKVEMENTIPNSQHQNISTLEVANHPYFIPEENVIISKDSIMQTILDNIVIPKDEAIKQDDHDKAVISIDVSKDLGGLNCRDETFIQPVEHFTISSSTRQIQISNVLDDMVIIKPKIKDDNHSLIEIRENADNQYKVPLILALSDPQIISTTHYLDNELLGICLNIPNNKSRSHFLESGDGSMISLQEKTENEDEISSDGRKIDNFTQINVDPDSDDDIFQKRNHYINSSKFRKA
jgi:hypothetical protein